MIEAPQFGSIANARADGDYAGGRGFWDNHSHRYEDAPEGTAYLGKPVSYEAETLDPVLPESQEAAQDLSPDRVQEERLE